MQDNDKKMKFIIDKEIILEDKEDFLKTKIYADNLTKIIESTDKDNVFTIGLFGGWGTGKSSIVKTSKNDLKNTNTKFINYDAWQYVNDSFRRTFLNKLQNELNYEDKTLMKKFYEDEHIDLGYKYKLSFVKFIFIIVNCLFLIFSIIIFDDLKAILLSLLTGNIALISFWKILKGIILWIFNQSKTSVTKPHLFAPEQFESYFDTIVSKTLGGKSIEKLVIVIDNIDRCNNDVAYNLLTDIKTFLSSKPYSIVFVIPVDDEALRKHIINSGKNKDYEKANKEKEEFLRKFFNVTIRIKPYGVTDMYSFAKQINEKHNLNFKPETISVASKEYARNPRRIIQLFNNLSAELNHYKPEFIEKNETLICCILIIREEYQKYYKKIINSPKAFLDLKDKDKDELKWFIEITKIYIRKVADSDLSLILTNTNSLFDDDIKEAIAIPFNNDIVLKFFKTKKEKTIDYIIYQLHNSVKHNLIETDLVIYLDLINKINEKYKLKNYDYKRIDEHITPYIIDIIINKSTENYTSNYEILCIYALFREMQNNNIKKEIVEQCKTKSRVTPLFNAVLKIFKDEDTAKKLSSIFTNDYESIEESTIEEFSLEQIEYLISDEYIIKIINNLSTNATSIETISNLDKDEKIKWLFDKKKNIDEKTYEAFFVKFTEFVDANLKRETIHNIAKILQFVNPYLELVQELKNINYDYLESLYSKIIDSMQIKPYLKENFNEDFHKQQQFIIPNFIEECITKNLYIQDIIKFMLNIIRITNNKIDIKSLIKQLFVKYRNIFNAEFVKFIKEEYSLTPILELIFQDDNYRNTNTIELLEYCFNQKNNKNEYILSDSDVTKKLENMLDYAYNGNNKSKMLIELLESLEKQQRYKDILSNLKKK